MCAGFLTRKPNNSHAYMYFSEWRSFFQAHKTFVQMQEEDHEMILMANYQLAPTRYQPITMFIHFLFKKYCYVELNFLYLKCDMLKITPLIIPCVNNSISPANYSLWVNIKRLLILLYNKFVRTTFIFCRLRRVQRPPHNPTAILSRTAEKNGNRCKP